LIRKKPNQIDRFEEVARALGCNEDETAFDEKLGKVARQKLSLAPVMEQKGGEPSGGSDQSDDGSGKSGYTG